MIPSYLKGYEKFYAVDPRTAGQAWFHDAKFGMLVHYGLYSLLGRGEWVMYDNQIHVTEYEQLSNIFTAEYFDADSMAELAVQSGMKYINFMARHHDSFCLFETAATDFHSVHSPARRDLVRELAVACEKKGLGLFLSYSYGTDWRHPYYLSNEQGMPGSRPNYQEPEPRYLYKEPQDFRRYIAFVHVQIRELLTNYGAIAGLWFIGAGPCYYRPELFAVEETYALIRALQPQCLIAFQQGVTGDEDFMSQDKGFTQLEGNLRSSGVSEEAVNRSNEVWRLHQDKRNEICVAMQNKGWGFVNRVKHMDTEEAMRKFRLAGEHNCNLLLNTGLYPDGAIPLEDIQTFQEMGRQIRTNGYEHEDFMAI
ncbi:alpha-L-fucosidase [Bacillus sp. 3255]|uniref:alpha-L-fucosidase n=1 Tax=Bacillus sp. 3255 TaxID=2817904 RepID=UPI00285B941B|nr:alpha-L-fucosidase [Bacillus sp. 3255]MDR6885363.1 alpha-L-fucosidase [Bacillus sp. 3255]